VVTNMLLAPEETQWLYAHCSNNKQMRICLKHERQHVISCVQIQHAAICASSVLCQYLSYVSFHTNFAISKRMVASQVMPMPGME